MKGYVLLVLLAKMNRAISGLDRHYEYDYDTTLWENENGDVGFW